jgi:hypothetical protein
MSAVDGTLDGGAHHVVGVDGLGPTPTSDRAC